jgi:kynurenine formamidase
VTRPRYDALPRLEGLDVAHAWDVLDHDLGTVQDLTAERVVAAAWLVRDGTVVDLNLPVTEPDPPLFGREPLHHTLYDLDRNTLDDRVDAFFPQASSQWDGLRHVRAREHGFFGGHQGGFAPGPGPLGIEHYARHGLVGRGVLLDIVALRADQGRAYDPLRGETITEDDLAAAADRQRVSVRPGDVLCVRTGWIEAYRGLDAAGRAAISAAPRISGLSGSEAMARYLWDLGIAALATDNPSVEVAPGDPAVGSLHRRLIPALGFALAELLDLQRLAALCAEDQRFAFLFVAVPMNLPGAVGSPANAVAIR